MGSNSSSSLKARFLLSFLFPLPIGGFQLDQETHGETFVIQKINALLLVHIHYFNFLHFFLGCFGVFFLGDSNWCPTVKDISKTLPGSNFYTCRLNMQQRHSFMHLPNSITILTFCKKELVDWKPRAKVHNIWW